MLIGISGKKQCGKDTICKMIRALDDRWEKHAFADKLKQALAVILDVKVEAFEDNIFKMSDSTIAKPEGGFYTYRELLQKFGTEVGRSISPNVWVDALFSNYSLEDDFWIITDVRFPSEADAIREHGGILIRVNRNTGYIDNHPSETSLDNYPSFDYIINNEDLDETIKEVESIMKENYFI